MRQNALKFRSLDMESNKMRKTPQYVSWFVGLTLNVVNMAAKLRLCYDCRPKKENTVQYTIHLTVRYHTIQYSSKQYNTTQYNTVLHSTGIIPFNRNNILTSVGRRFYVA